MKRWKGHVIFNIYVNHLGDICLRKKTKSCPPGGVIFATTQRPSSWDEEGYPVFQGVRGVCAKITFQTEISFEDPSLWSHVSCAFHARVGASQTSLKDLLSRRQQLLTDLSNLKRGQLEKCFHQQKQQLKCDSVVSPSSSSDGSLASEEDDGFAFLSSDEEDERKISTTTTESEVMLKLKDPAYVREMKRVKDEISRLEKLILFRYRKKYGKELTGAAPAIDTTS
jgi:hypothetical protein